MEVGDQGQACIECVSPTGACEGGMVEALRDGSLG